MKTNLVDGKLGARSGARSGHAAARVERRHRGRRAQKTAPGELHVGRVEPTAAERSAVARVARAFRACEARPFLGCQAHRAQYQVRLEVALEREAHVPHRVLRVEQLVLLQLRLGLGLVLGAREDRLSAQLSN